MQDKIINLISKWRNEARILDEQFALLNNRKWYSQMSPEEQSEWNYLRDRSGELQSCANQLESVLKSSLTPLSNPNDGWE